ncbi:hypothetical protein Prudu_014940, partial [Prunus dulcis]
QRPYHTHGLTMASHQDELLVKISEIEKSVGKILEMEKTLGQLLDFSKSITQELRLLRPGAPIKTTPLTFTVIENYNPNHPNQEAYDLKDTEIAAMTFQIAGRYYGYGNLFGYIAIT